MEGDNPEICSSQFMRIQITLKLKEQFDDSKGRDHKQSRGTHWGSNEGRAARERHSPSVPLGVMEVLFIWELSSLGPLGDSLLPLSRLCGLVRSCISIDLKTRNLPCDRCTKFITPPFNVLTTWHLLWKTGTQKSHCISFLRLETVHLASDFSPFLTWNTKRHGSSYGAKASRAAFKSFPLLV